MKLNVPAFPETKQLYVWVWHFLCCALYSDPTFVYKAGHQTCISAPINAVQFLFLYTPIKKWLTSDILHCLKNFTRFLSLWIIIWRSSDHLNPKNCLHILQWSSVRENCFKRNSKWCHRWNFEVETAGGWLVKMTIWDKMRVNQHFRCWNLEAQRLQSYSITAQPTSYKC